MELEISWEEKSVSNGQQQEINELLRNGISEALLIAGGFEDSEIGVVLVDDETIRLLNKNYRGIDRPTDVLSFALQEKGEEEPDIFLDSLWESDTEEIHNDFEELPDPAARVKNDYSVELIMEEEFGQDEDYDETWPRDREEPLLYDDLVLGDIVISVEKARAQAEEYGHSLAREIVYLAIHGTLHLLGYDHYSDAEGIEMRRLEEHVMNKIGLPR